MSSLRTVLLALLLSIVAGNIALAQDDISITRSGGGRKAINTVYVELGGPALLYSINYDRLVLDNVSARIGLSYLPLALESGDFIADTTSSDTARALQGWKFDMNIFMIPITGNYLLGSGSSKFDVGAGLMIVAGDIELVNKGEDFEFKEFLTNFTGVAGLAHIGYRYQPREGGFNFRTGLDFLFTDGGFLPTGGTSFGYTF
jgi:hypothetical protein